MSILPSPIRGLLRAIRNKYELQKIGSQGEEFLKSRAVALYAEADNCDICKKNRADLPKFIVSSYQKKLIALMTVFKTVPEIEALAEVEGMLQPYDLSKLIVASSKIDAWIDDLRPDMKNEALVNALSDTATIHWEK